MGDLSIKEIMGIIHDLFVTAKYISISVDFVVVNMGNDMEVPLILGPPFLATKKALVSVEDKEHNLVMNGERLPFDVNQAMWQPLELKVIIRIDTMIGHK